MKLESERDKSVCERERERERNILAERSLQNSITLLNKHQETAKKFPVLSNQSKKYFLIFEIFSIVAVISHVSLAPRHSVYRLSA